MTKENPYFNRSIHTMSKGKNTEDKFLKIMTSMGYNCVKASVNEDKYSHVDYHIFKNDIKKCMVDIKSKSRYGWTAEVINNWGYLGSLYGRQDYIVYVSDDKMWFVKPSAIILYFNKRVWKEKLNSSEIYNLSGEEKYEHTYGRMTQTLGDSDKICEDKWFILPDILIDTLSSFTLDLTTLKKSV